jgi:hypothetical protein
MFAGSESTARPHGPPDQQGLGGTRGAPHRPPAPNKRRMTDWHRVSCFPITGRGHKNQPMMNEHTSLQATGIACRPFGGPARSQPAETIQTPLIRPHVPAVPTPPRQPHPASPWACEQMEATGGAGRAPLGVKRPYSRLQRRLFSGTIRHIRKIPPELHACGQAPVKANISRSIGCLAAAARGGPTDETVVVGGSSIERDVGVCLACRVVDPLARIRPRPRLLGNRGAGARERKPFAARL